MGAYDEAEAYKIAGLFLLNNLANKFDKNSFSFYRDDGLALNGLSLEIECDLKIVNYLDITLDLNTDTYKPYRKRNHETLYIHAQSNYPADILKQLPTLIESRLSNLSGNL